jgi:hypothetical protein
MTATTNTRNMSSKGKYSARERMRSISGEVRSEDAGIGKPINDFTLLHQCCTSSVID